MRRKVAVIIQARMGSVRLPGKVLEPILDRPMLWHLVNRVREAKLVDRIIVATTTNEEDKKIVEYCQKEKIDYFQGSENDVLDRYYQAAKKFEATTIVRITGDCPLADPGIIDRAIEKFFSEDYDHLGVATGAGVAGKNIFKFPDGLDCEVFKFEVLEKGALTSTSQLEREHVTMYTWTRPEQFKLGNLFSERDYSMYRLTVDHPDDLEVIKEIFGRLYKVNPFFSLEDVIELIEENPGILEINKQHLGKEGYEQFINEKLRKEFESIPSRIKPSAKPDAVVVLSAEENEVIGENKDRIDQAIKLAKKFKARLIYLGTQGHNLSFRKYLDQRNFDINIALPVVRQEASTKTQIQDLARFLNKNFLRDLVILSSSYHIPRIKRYCVNYLNKSIKTSFLGVGKIKEQQLQKELEIKKLIRYSQKGDLPLLID